MSAVLPLYCLRSVVTALPEVADLLGLSHDMPRVLIERHNAHLVELLYCLLYCPLYCLQSVGTVLPEVADLLGLGHDVVVAPGSGDNAMSALGSGITQ